MQRANRARPQRPWLSGSWADRLFAWLARGAALLTLALLLGIMVSLVIGAWPAIQQYGLGFLDQHRMGSGAGAVTAAW